ncbi:Fur family transcriptional regulator [Methanobacterium sp. MBAC-LM]|jgi:Fe2+ or Zn2+ uptake regulation protein|uniref:Fur family transcriptional regulator n=1 Tax=Methanobacterium sp. MBAC-LM TaxID=3412034 RepID=UPI003C7831BE
MKKELRAHGVKITPQRLEIIGKLEELGSSHPSFNDVYKAVEAKYPSISRSTVYENLKLLVELGIIGTFHYKGEVHYEMNFEPHVNMVNSSGKIVDIKNDEIKDHLKEIERIINEKEGIKIKNLMVLVE